MSAGERVSFLVAGVQKGGTTTLFDYLREHPQLQLAACKEVHFFDDDAGVDWGRPDYGRYHAAFDPADGRQRGEATPIYIYWPGSLERIAAYNPGMRIILLFRDPVQRAWSQWRMEHARGFETEPFAFAIREGRERVTRDRVTPGWHRVFSYVERGFYGQQLRRLFALFPRENVLLLRSRDLKRDPDVTLRRICRFLDVAEPGGRFGYRELNVGTGRAAGATIDAEDELYLRSVFAEDQLTFERLSNLRLAE